MQTIGDLAVADLSSVVPLQVNPVPWARAQMACTLAFHIILVPLGVSWAAMTLIANYRAIRRHDVDSLRLAQRWSTYMAVTFAVGAVGARGGGRGGGCRLRLAAVTPLPAGGGGGGGRLPPPPLVGGFFCLGG